MQEKSDQKSNDDFTSQIFIIFYEIFKTFFYTTWKTMQTATSDDFETIHHTNVQTMKKSNRRKSDS